MAQLTAHEFYYKYFGHAITHGAEGLEPMFLFAEAYHKAALAAEAAGETGKQQDHNIIDHLAFVYVHDGIEPSDDIGGCFCDICNHFRAELDRIRFKEAQDYYNNKYGKKYGKEPIK